MTADMPDPTDMPDATTSAWVGTDRESLVLRPSASAPRARRQLIEGMVLGIVLLVVLTLMQVFAGSPLGWVLISLCVVWYGLLPLLYFRNACLYVGGGRVGATSLFGRKRETAVMRVAAIKVVWTGRRASRIVLEDAGGEPLLAVYGSAWRTSQVDKLRRRLGIQTPR